jgi:flavin-binding protein dodecin
MKVSGWIIGSHRPLFREETRGIMAKKSAPTESVYNVVEVIGTSSQSWEDAARNAVETASRTLRNLRIAEVVKMDMKVEDGKVTGFRTRVLLSFKYDG